MKTKLIAIAVLLLSITQPSPASAAAWRPVATTVAGRSGSGSDANQLASPYGIAVDSDGALLIADHGNHRVQKVTFTDGTADIATTDSGGSGAGSSPAQLFGPLDVAVGSDGAIFISNYGSHRVQRRIVRSDGTLAQATTIAGGTGQGSDSDQLDHPAGLALGADGSLFIADTDNNRIQKITFDANGVPNAATTVAGGNGIGSDIDQISSPRGLAIDADGSLYITDTDNHRIQRITFDSDGTPQRAITVLGGNGWGSDANQLASPFGIAVDAEGTLYVADRMNHRIQRVTFDSTGSPRDAITVFGNGQGSAVDQLDTPVDLVVGPDGTAYISDFGNNRVQQVTFDTTKPAANVAVNLASPNTVRVGDIAAVNFSCSDTGGSGVDTCTATLEGEVISSGTTLDTSKRSSKTLLITATDNVGNVSIKVHELVVHGIRELTGEYAQVTDGAAAIARLYMATFTREPDANGFEYWTSTGASTNLLATASYFAASPEFDELFGSTTNAEFIDLMYSNVMTRDADPAGHAYWLDLLDGSMTQAQMLLWFSESPEFMSLTGTS